MLQDISNISTIESLEKIGTLKPDVQPMSQKTQTIQVHFQRPASEQLYR